MGAADEIYDDGQNLNSDFSGPKGKSKEIHLEKFISLIPVPYYLGWSLFAAAFLAISILDLMMIEKSFRSIDISPILSIIIALESTAIIWAHDKMKSFGDILINIVELPKDVIIKLCEKQEADIFNDKRLIAFAIIFIVFVHVLGIDNHDFSFSSSISDIVFNLGYYFGVYLMGSGLYIMIMTGRAVYNIGELPLKADALFSDFQAIGILYSKFTIYAASAYVMWGFFHMIVPPQFSSFQMMSWFSGFAILLFAYFILPQYSIHKMMKSTKKEKIEMFSSQLRAALDESSRAPSDENVSYLKDMLSVQNHLDQMCEWPFGTYEILRLALIIIIPFIVLLLEIVYGVIK